MVLVVTVANLAINTREKKERHTQTNSVYEEKKRKMKRFDRLVSQVLVVVACARAQILTTQLIQQHSKVQYAGLNY